MTHASYIKRVD